MQAKIREITINDAEAVFRFFLAQGKVREEEHKLWLARWKLLFQLNPWFSDVLHHPIGWVIEGEKDAMEGYAGNIILPYVYEGITYKVACITGLVVAPAYRRYSMLMLREYFTQTGTDIFMSSTANEVSGNIFETLKMSKFPAGYYNTMYYFIINPTKVVYAFLQQRLPVFLVRPIAVFIGAILASYLYLHDAVIVGRSKAARGGRIIEKSLEDLDETYDAFWELASNQRDQFMLLRTKEALRWHFARAGNWNAPTVFCYYEKDQMLGYVIIDKHLEKESGILRFRCVDILTLDDKKGIIKQLMVAAYIYAKREGADLFVCYFLPLSVQAVLGSLAHLRRKRSGGVYMRILNPKLSSADIMQKWYATCADGDSAFWSLTVPR